MYNMLRDADEVLFDVLEVVRPEQVVKTKVVSGSNGEIRLMIDTETPKYLNIADVLVLIRKLIKDVLLMDEAEKVRELKRYYVEQIEEEIEQS
jgi:predicted transcriptional regulator